MASRIKAAALVFRGGGNSKNLLAFPSLIPKQGGDKLGSDGINSARSLGVFGASISGLLSCAAIAYSDEPKEGSVCPSYQWPNKGILSSYDQASISKGQAVYHSSCASCHTHLSRGVSFTKEETKAVQSEIEVVEESKDKGETYSCLGKLRNCPQSNTNEQEVRFANRCVPSIDLSLITKASHNSQSYLYALLTSYRGPNDPLILKRMNGNPYLTNGAVEMPKMLHAERYQHCRPTKVPQVGRDVVTSFV